MKPSSESRLRTPGWCPGFDENPRPAAAFVGAFLLWLLVSNGLYGWLVGRGDPSVTRFAASAVSSSVQLGIAVAFLRYEGVRLRDVGLSRRLLGPSVVAVAGAVLLLNGAVAGLVALGGGGLSVGFYPLYRSPPFDLALPTVVAGGVVSYLFVGPAEELAFRGYLQNKLDAVLGVGDPRVRAALAVTLAAVVFALLHVPTIVLLGNASLGGSAFALLLNALSGVAFGAVYVLTRNLYLVAALHGFGDWWPLAVDPAGVAWPNWGVVLVVYAIVVVAYRRWATGSVRRNPAAVAAD